MNTPYYRKEVKQMTRFTAGILTGGIIGAIGMGCLMSDNKTRRQIMRNHRRAARKTEDLINGVSDMF